MSEIKTLQARLAEDNVQAEVRRGNRDPHPASDYPMDDWTVVLTLGRRRLPISWWTGFGLTGTPTARDVLARLLSEAADVDTSHDFAGWSAQHRFDRDDQKQGRLYRARLRQTETLRSFLGDKYGSYLRDTVPGEDPALPAD
jgi:hypothetical protein